MKRLDTNPNMLCMSEESRFKVIGLLAKTVCTASFQFFQLVDKRLKSKAGFVFFGDGRNLGASRLGWSLE